MHLLATAESRRGHEMFMFSFVLWRNAVIVDCGELTEIVGSYSVDVASAVPRHFELNENTCIYLRTTYACIVKHTYICTLSEQFD